MLSPIEQIALSKYTAEKGARSKVKPGEYTGRLCVDLEYDVKVGEDYTGTHPIKVPWADLVATLMSKINGVTIEAVLREALDNDIDTSRIKDEIEATMALIVDQTERPFRGKVTGAAVVTGVRAMGGLVR
jgi:hypothetical protein